MKQKSKGNAKTSPGKSGKKANKSVLLNRLIVIGTAILILGGLVAGFFIWQNSIYYTVTFEDVTGATYTYDALTVKKGGDFTFEISLQQRFAIYDDLFAVTVNGEKIEKTDDHYEIKNVDKNLSIFVSGVGTMNLTITGTSLLGGTTTEEDLYIPYGVEEIAASSFISSAAFKKVVIPDSVKLIGPEAFLNCINLATIEINILKT